jgi:peptidoglycan/LPS O-acetylase OafA/YrhL
VMVFCGATVVVSFVVRLLHATGTLPSPYETISIFSLEGFGIGAIVAYQIANPRLAETLQRNSVLAICFVIAAADAIFLINRSALITPFRHIAGNFAIGIILFNIVRRPEMGLSKILRHKVLVYVGVISYGLYLWHFPVFEMLKEFRQPNLPMPVRHLLKFGISFALAIFTYHVIEKPVMRVRARLRPQAAAVTPPIEVPSLGG